MALISIEMPKKCQICKEKSVDIAITDNKNAMIFLCYSCAKKCVEKWAEQSINNEN